MRQFAVCYNSGGVVQVFRQTSWLKEAVYSRKNMELLYPDYTWQVMTREGLDEQRNRGVL